MKIESVIAKACGSREKASGKEELLNWIKSILVAVVLTLILTNFIFVFVRVDGESMNNTLQNNDRLIVDRLAYTFSTPRRGDIVILHYPNDPEPNKTYVKRCVGVAGDYVEIKDGHLYVNDEPLTESYIYLKYDEPMGDFPRTLVKDGYIFVMGDNRNDSKDSRMVGQISLSLLLGKASFVIWPISNWEFIQ